MNHPGKLRRLALAVLLSAAGGASQAQTDQETGGGIAKVNPLLTRSSLPNNMPRFDLIEDEHFLPAIEQGMRVQLAEVAEIAANPAEPTFENTIVAMEKSGQLLDRAARIFFNISSADTNETRQGIQREVRPKLAAHRDAILLDEALFQRVASLFEAPSPNNPSPGTRISRGTGSSSVFGTG